MTIPVRANAVARAHPPVRSILSADCAEQAGHDRRAPEGDHRPDRDTCTRNCRKEQWLIRRHSNRSHDHIWAPQKPCSAWTSRCQCHDYQHHSAHDQASSPDRHARCRAWGKCLGGAGCPPQAGRDDDEKWRLRPGHMCRLWQHTTVRRQSDGPEIISTVSV